MSAEVKITLNIGEDIITDEMERRKKLEEIQRSRGTEYIKKVAGRLSITPEAVIQIPNEEVQIGTIKREFISIEDEKPIFKTPDADLYYGIDKDSTVPKRFRFYSIEGTDVLIRVYSSAVKDMADRDDEKRQRFEEGIKIFIASEINGLLESQ